MTGLVVFSTEVEFAIVLIVFIVLCLWVYLAESSR